MSHIVNSCRMHLIAWKEWFQGRFMRIDITSFWIRYTDAIARHDPIKQLWKSYKKRIFYSKSTIFIHEATSALHGELEQIKKR